MEILLSKIFTRAQAQSGHQLTGQSRRLSAYVDTMYTRTFGKWQLVKPHGETVECVLEPGNFHDRNAVAVSAAERWLPRKVSRVRALLLKTGGIVRCTVTGRR